MTCIMKLYQNKQNKRISQVKVMNITTLNKKDILDKFNNIDEKMLITRVLDKAVRAAKSWTASWTDFLDPYQIRLVERVLRSINDIEYRFEGGYNGAERMIVIFEPAHLSDLSGYSSENPLSLINIKPKRESNITHRDYLGSLMSLGIKREKIGDIIVESESCSVVVLKDIATYILYNLSKVSNIGVDVIEGKIGDLKVAEPKTKEIKCTVPSLRLDCIVSNGFGISRSKLAPLFKSGKVYVNWEPEESLSARIKEGDMISVKGKGRVVLDQIGNKTRKDRISIVLKRFV